MQNKPSYIKRKIPRILLVIGLLLVAAQFIHPTITNPPVSGDLQAPPEVKAIIQRSCYNCHSNETKLSWYDKIVPAYWSVADHIKDGRAVLNFSEWGHLATGDQNAKLWESVNQVIFGTMPLSQYAFVHRGAKISPDEMDILKKYLLSIKVVQPSDSEKIASLANQYKLLANNDTITNVPTALNGISFFPDYKNWQLVSTTNRYDNGTLRVILGNDVAIKAISENKTNPWPNGSAFAKVAWAAIKDSAGNLNAGPFIQVEFMTKDDQKYASTKGWGFARFKTPKLVPYGKDALFATECVNCHQPMKENDYVFTKPVQSIPASLNVSAIRNLSVNNSNSTMSVVFANKNSRLAKELNWKQQEDDHWFGGLIPGELLKSDSLQIVTSQIPFF